MGEILRAALDRKAKFSRPNWYTAEASAFLPQNTLTSSLTASFRPEQETTFMIMNVAILLRADNNNIAPTTGAAGSTYSLRKVLSSYRFEDQPSPWSNAWQLQNNLHMFGQYIPLNDNELFAVDFNYVRFDAETGGTVEISCIFTGIEYRF